VKVNQQLVIIHLRSLVSLWP